MKKLTGICKRNNDERYFNLYRASRWIAVKHNYNPTKRNSLWDYVTDGSGYRSSESKFNPEDGLYLDYFEWNGRKFALDQFLGFGNPFYLPEEEYYLENGEWHRLAGVDMDNYWRPIRVEFDEWGEHVRVYTAEYEGGF